MTAQAPVQMLQDAADLLKPGGLVYATHWRPVVLDSFGIAVHICIMIILYFIFI